MHRLFREALNNATGKSQFAIVVFIDIRGFSAFSQTCESPDTAMFIKRVYIKLIDSYFPFASFYKSTGDGLLFIIPFDEHSLGEVSQKVVQSCIDCHSEFSNICNNDPMINFKVPDKIGIGIARGTACCLVSGDKIIDYSGRLINLTSRLTGLARPLGIVIDGGFRIDLLSSEQQSVFEEANVYLDGIAEDEPIQIYFTKEFTVIPKRNRQPIAEKRWGHETDVKLYRDICKFARFKYPLGSEPVSLEGIKLTVTHDKVTGGKIDKGYVTIIDDFTDFTYEIVGGVPIVWIDFAELSKKLEKSKVKRNMNVTFDIDYVKK